MAILKEEESFNSRDIETAKKPEDAIVIVPEKECKEGLKYLRETFEEMFPDPEEVSIVPILRSGLPLGVDLAGPLNEINSMRMSYYRDDASRLEKPICLQLPDLAKIVTVEGKVKRVVFTECVVDSQETVLAAMEVINSMIDELNIKEGIDLPHPLYATFAYASKTGDKQVSIPNLVTAFKVHPDIWLGGLGCDLPGDSARELPFLVGILSPFAMSMPQMPYYFSFQD